MRSGDGENAGAAGGVYNARREIESLGRPFAGSAESLALITTVNRRPFAIGSSPWSVWSVRYRRLGLGMPLRFLGMPWKGRRVRPIYFVEIRAIANANPLEEPAYPAITILPRRSSVNALAASPGENPRPNPASLLPPMPKDPS